MNTRLGSFVVPSWAAPLIVLLLAVGAYFLSGVPLTVLVLAAAALLLVIWLLWNSVQALAGETELSFEEAFSLGARSAEEEQKRAVLRALKDLEYERSVGKISEDDFHEYSARYRAEAKRLMQSLDEGLAVQRKQVESEIARRLAKAEPEPELESPAEDAEKEPETAAPATRECPSCQTKNELDARFCKACGKAMDSEEATP